MVPGQQPLILVFVKQTDSKEAAVVLSGFYSFNHSILVLFYFLVVSNLEV